MELNSAYNYIMPKKYDGKWRTEVLLMVREQREATKNTNIKLN